MSESDERPRPRYGEYATPEQQRAHTRQPLLPVSAPPQPHLRPQPPTTVAARPPRGADRLITLALLAYGLYSVITAVPQMLDYSGFARAWIDAIGIDAEFTNVAAGRLWGAIAAAVFALGWALTAVFAWRTLSRGRLASWIPLVGAVIAFAVSSVLLVVPLLTDPGITSVFGI